MGLRGYTKAELGAGKTIIKKKRYLVFCTVLSGKALHKQIGMGKGLMVMIA